MYFVNHLFIESSRSQPWLCIWITWESLEKIDPWVPPQKCCFNCSGGVLNITMGLVGVHKRGRDRHHWIPSVPVPRPFPVTFPSFNSRVLLHCLLWKLRHGRVRGMGFEPPSLPGQRKLLSAMMKPLTVTHCSLLLCLDDLAPTILQVTPLNVCH